MLFCFWCDHEFSLINMRRGYIHNYMYARYPIRIDRLSSLSSSLFSLFFYLSLHMYMCELIYQEHINVYTMMHMSRSASNHVWFNLCRQLHCSLLVDGPMYIPLSRQIVLICCCHIKLHHTSNYDPKTYYRVHDDGDGWSNETREW